MTFMIKIMMMVMMMIIDDNDLQVQDITHKTFTIMMMMMFTMLLVMTIMMMIMIIDHNLQVQDITHVTWRKGDDVLDLHSEERVR